MKLCPDLVVWYARSTGSERACGPLMAEVVSFCGFCVFVYVVGFAFVVFIMLLSFALCCIKSIVERIYISTPYTFNKLLLSKK